MKIQYRSALALAIVCLIAASSIFSLKTRAAAQPSLIARIISRLAACDLHGYDSRLSASQSGYRADNADEKFRRSKKRIPGKYIVVLDDEAAGGRGGGSRARAIAVELGPRMTHASIAFLSMHLTALRRRCPKIGLSC